MRLHHPVPHEQQPHLKQQGGIPTPALADGGGVPSGTVDPSSFVGWPQRVGYDDGGQIGGDPEQSAEYPEAVARANAIYEDLHRNLEAGWQGPQGQDLGFAEGGDVGVGLPDPGTQDAPAEPDPLMSYATRANAWSPEEYKAAERALDPQGQMDPKEAYLNVLASQQDPEDAERALLYGAEQHDHARAAARHLADSGMWDKAAAMFAEGLKYVPKAWGTTLDQTSDGIVANTLDGRQDGPTLLTPEGISALVHSDDSTYDAIQQNGLAAALKNAAGKVGGALKQNFDLSGPPEKAGEPGVGEKVQKGFKKLTQPSAEQEAQRRSPTDIRSTEPTFAKQGEDQTAVRDEDRPYGGLNPADLKEGGFEPGKGGVLGGPPPTKTDAAGRMVSPYPDKFGRKVPAMSEAEADRQFQAHNQREPEARMWARAQAQGAPDQMRVGGRMIDVRGTLADLRAQHNAQDERMDAAGLPSGVHMYDRLAGGSYRIRDQSELPQGWRMMAAEDPRGGWIAVPPGVKPPPEAHPERETNPGRTPGSPPDELYPQATDTGRDRPDVHTITGGGEPRVPGGRGRGGQSTVGGAQSGAGVATAKARGEAQSQLENLRYQHQLTLQANRDVGKLDQLAAKLREAQEPNSALEFNKESGHYQLKAPTNEEDEKTTRDRGGVLNWLFSGGQSEAPQTGGIPAQAAAPERTIINERTGERMVLRNGQWTPIK